MSFILRSKLKAFWIVLAIVLIVEIVVRILPMEITARTGIYLSNHRSHLLDSSAPEYDFIILGESRSLSLKGHKKTKAEPYSSYNFSVPAMGSHYFSWYFKKYMQNRKVPPKAVLFAGDPSVFQSSWNTALHDPGMNYTDSREDTLADYLRNRFVRRIEIATGQRSENKIQKDMHDVVWETYSHRYLHLFSLSESMQQYRGAERLFLIYERLPLEYYSFRWREQIAHYVFGFRASYFKDVTLPEYCFKSCASTWDENCYPDVQRIQQNQNLDRHLSQFNGQINLADLKGPQERWKFMALREKAFEMQEKGLQNAEVDLRPLENLVVESKKQGALLLYLLTPTLERYTKTKYYTKFFSKLNELMHKHENLKLVPFNQKYLKEDMFVDNAHYTCEGSEVVNRDFTDSVMPKVLHLVKKQGRQSEK